MCGSIHGLLQAFEGYLSQPFNWQHRCMYISIHIDIYIYIYIICVYICLIYNGEPGLGALWATSVVSLRLFLALFDLASLQFAVLRFT